MSSTSNGKPLRFACLIRVSTERQEKRGESLRTQHKANERDVARLGGTVVGVYGGQEHGTAGWERKELDRLLADAARGRFDAVIVAYADRWSRDNVRSEQGLEVFRERGVRFFIGAMEMDLFDPHHRFILSMNSVVGGFVAAQGAKKAIESKIERARRGHPTCGRLPPGRTFDRDTGTWGVDEEARRVFAEVADRFLGGESPQALADELGLNRSNLFKTLRERCGTVWNQEFKSKRLNIHEVVPTTVPRLLPEATIRAVRDRLKGRRTYLHGAPRYDYLLNGRVFCAGCGALLTGQPDRGGGTKLSYRHAHNKTAKATAGARPDRAECPWKKPRPWVPARELERAVLIELSDMFGNKAAIERAVKRATPDADKASKRRDRLTAELGKVTAGRDRVLALVGKGHVTEAQAENQLAELKAREAELRDDLDRIEAALADVPDSDEIEEIVAAAEAAHYERLGTAPPRTESELELFGYVSLVDPLNPTAGQDRRALIESVFDTPMPDGTPAGVYVTPAGPRRFTYELRGRLVARVKPGVLSLASTWRNAPPIKLAGVLG